MVEASSSLGEVDMLLELWVSCKAYIVRVDLQHMALADNKKIM